MISHRLAVAQHACAAASGAGRPWRRRSGCRRRCARRRRSRPRWRRAAGAGSRPCGVNTYTLSGNRSTLTLSRNSSELPPSCMLAPGSRATRARAPAAPSRRSSSLLVLPVRGDAGLGDPVHVLGADLHFDRHAVRPEQRGVQRLVAVDARDRDVVLEASRHRLEHAVHDAERAVAGVGAVDDDAQAVHVDDLGERRALALHLLVDAVEVLLARLDLGLDVGLQQRGAAAAARSWSRNSFWLPRARFSARSSTR